LDKEILLYATVNLGMAVAIPEGLIAVVIPGAEKLTMAELEWAIKDKTSRARKGQLRMADVEGGTFTVSNLGMYGVEGGFSLPRPPEGAILLIGAAQPKPIVNEGQVVIREMARFSLNYDHQFIDGASAALFYKIYTAS
jgi:pyruvate dehydrogenase E2 component (dihydrolipoamide acetyltransferase)